MRRLLLLTGLVLLLTTNCGGTFQDYLQAAITSNRAACTAAEWEIVNRAGTTKADDAAELAKVRDGCNRVYKALHELAKGSE